DGHGSTLVWPAARAAISMTRRYYPGRRASQRRIASKRAQRAASRPLFPLSRSLSGAKNAPAHHLCRFLALPGHKASTAQEKHAVRTDLPPHRWPGASRRGPANQIPVPRRVLIARYPHHRVPEIRFEAWFMGENGVILKYKPIQEITTDGE